MAYSATQFQLTHLLQRVFRRLKVARMSTATGGTATTIVDTKLVDYLGDSNEDDYLNNWTVIVVRDAGGAAADPEGKFERVSDYDDGGTITTATLTTAVAAGDTYMYISPDFPLFDMIEVVNDALISLGNIVAVDTSLTSAANQTEYSLPVALKGNQLLNVEVQGITTDSNDNRYVPVPNWKIVPAAPGSAATLVLPQLTSGYTIRISYLGLHPRVSAYADYISEYIHPEVAVSACVAHALQWYNTQRGGADKFWLQREDRAWNQLDIIKQTYPIVLPAGQVQGFPHWSNDTAQEFAPVPQS
jgi:hypothetical protein